MALVKLVTGWGWRAAAEALGRTDEAADRSASYYVSLLKRADRYVHFIERLHQFADSYEQDTWTDFGTRRTALGGLDEIPEPAWHTICAEAQVRPGKKGARSRNAAVWLWADLTGGDPRLAPGRGLLDEPSFGELYRRFERNDLPCLRTPLRRYGEALLQLNR